MLIEWSNLDCSLVSNSFSSGVSSTRSLDVPSVFPVLLSMVGGVFCWFIFLLICEFGVSPVGWCLFHGLLALALTVFHGAFGSPDSLFLVVSQAKIVV